ncbi:hypothetical protein NIES4075_62160 [Tolypothrix sp. NIES-4075]|nr:hypothetical protein NIES4075_62160 [Tolypothrix sp. NIES-4075]
MYFETRRARNTTSLFQAPPFMDGVSQIAPFPQQELPLVDLVRYQGN